MFEVPVLVVSMLTGALAAVTGFGIGSLLTPLLALHVDTRLAVAAMSVRTHGESRWVAFGRTARLRPIKTEPHRDRERGGPRDRRRTHADLSGGEHQEMMTVWLAIAMATVGVVVGTLAGSRVLARIPDLWFRRVLAVVLAALGVAIMVRGLSER